MRIVRWRRQQRLKFIREEYSVEKCQRSWQRGATLGLYSKRLVQRTFGALNLTQRKQQQHFQVG